MQSPLHLPQQQRAVGSQRPSRAVVSRALLGFEAATFAVAAAVHHGVLVAGHGHAPAATAETVIALALLAGLALSRAPHPWPARAAFVAQAFALVGVVIGLVTIAIGIGPQTAVDVAYHLTIVPVLGAGLAICARDAIISGADRWARR